MSRATRPRHRVITRSSAALIGLLILGLCEVGTVLVAKESAAVHSGRRPLSDKAQQQTWHQHQEKDGLRTIRRSQSGWDQPAELERPSIFQDSSSLPSSAPWIDPFLRHQRNPVIPNRGKETAPPDGADAGVPPGYWRDDELDAAGDQAESRSNLQQLNYHEAQLARLHGLGPAEISALSSWQHKLRLHALPNRLPATTGWHYQPPSFLPKNSLPLYGSSKSSLHSQQVLTPFDDADIANSQGNERNSHPLTQQLVHQFNQSKLDASDNLLLLPLWPKRSASEMKKSDRENNKNRNAANRKEKMEAGSGNMAQASSKGKAKSSRKQQQQQQHFQESSHRQLSGVGAAVPGAAGAIQHEHNGRPSAGSSSTPDVNRMNRNLATQFLLRSPRENRQYDVPIIGKS